MVYYEGFIVVFHDMLENKQKAIGLFCTRGRLNGLNDSSLTYLNQTLSYLKDR